MSVSCNYSWRANYEYPADRIAENAPDAECAWQRVQVLAIFVVDKTYSETEATISFPFEYLPLPEKGDVVDALSRGGEFVCKGTVVRVMNPVRNDHTPVITMAVPKEHIDEVRTMRRLRLPEPGKGFERLSRKVFLWRM